MPQPIALCLECLDCHSPSDRYTRCVAIAGRQPGLGLAASSQIVWKSDGPVACELWVSADDRLILYRPEGAVQVIVRRAIRVLDVPAGKPVVLLDQDELEIGGKRVRVHVHGLARSVHAPAPLQHERSHNLQIAAAVALSMTVAGCGAQKVEVRDNPPAAMPDPPPPPPPPLPDAGTEPEAGEVLVPTAPGYASPPPETATPPAAPVAPLQDAGISKKKDAAPPIQVRESPPDPHE